MEARLAEEAADQRARASEIRREKRMAKIKFMHDMDDRTEVGLEFWGNTARCLLADDIAVDCRRFTLTRNFIAVLKSHCCGLERVER